MLQRNAMCTLCPLEICHDAGRAVGVAIVRARVRDQEDVTLM